MELNKLYNMDCLIGMQEIPSGSVDLIICDPPYGTIKGIGKSTEKFNKDTTWDVVIPTDRLFDQYTRILRNNGTLVLFSQEPYTMHLRTFRGKNLEFSYPMIWLKNYAGNPLNAKRAPLSYFEDISVWRKRVNILSKEQPTGEGIDDFIFNLPDGAASVSNVLEFAKDTDTWHPTQKPLALIAHLIRQYSNPGDTVLDTCMGSATTAVAAIRTGRNWIGYEMNKEFFTKAERRIKETLATPTLF